MQLRAADPGAAEQLLDDYVILRLIRLIGMFPPTFAEVSPICSIDWTRDGPVFPAHSPSILRAEAAAPFGNIALKDSQDYNVFYATGLPPGFTGEFTPRLRSGRGWGFETEAGKRNPAQRDRAERQWLLEGFFSA
jgi:hypothetical protein